MDRDILIQELRALCKSNAMFPAREKLLVIRDLQKELNTLNKKAEK